MSDFFTRLALRARGGMPTLQPLVRPRYAPVPEPVPFDAAAFDAAPFVDALAESAFADTPPGSASDDTPRDAEAQLDDVDVAAVEPEEMTARPPVLSKAPGRRLASSRRAATQRVEIDTLHAQERDADADEHLTRDAGQEQKTARATPLAPIDAIHRSIAEREPAGVAAHEPRSAPAAEIAIARSERAAEPSLFPAPAAHGHERLSESPVEAIVAAVPRELGSGTEAPPPRSVAAAATALAMTFASAPAVQARTAEPLTRDIDANGEENLVIEIGVVEVHPAAAAPVVPQAAAPPPARATRQPRLSLSDYLAARERR